MYPHRTRRRRQARDRASVGSTDPARGVPTKSNMRARWRQPLWLVATSGELGGGFHFSFRFRMRETGMGREESHSGSRPGEATWSW